MNNISNSSQTSHAAIADCQPARTKTSVYARNPLENRDGIPVFSVSDEYSANYERIAHDHLAVAEISKNNPFIEEELWVELEDSTAGLVAKYSSPGNLILDVGVGLGRLLCRFDALNRYGMDISPDYLTKANRLGIEVCLARIEDMPYEDETFDLVTCTDVLEHVLDLNDCLKKIIRTLKHGGTLIVRVPYRENLARYAQADYPYQYAHLRNFDEHGLTLLFERVLGLRVLEYNTIGYLPEVDKIRYKFPFAENIFSRLIGIVKTVSPGLGKRLLHSLFLPVELNIAVRKP